MASIAMKLELKSQHLPKKIWFLSFLKIVQWECRKSTVIYDKYLWIYFPCYIKRNFSLYTVVLWHLLHFQVSSFFHNPSESIPASAMSTALFWIGMRGARFNWLGVSRFQLTMAQKPCYTQFYLSQVEANIKRSHPCTQLDYALC